MNEDGLILWTIGHSTRPLGEFLELLSGQNIQLLADVRHFPGSRRFPQYGQAELSKSLSQAGIEYVHFPELGGRRRPVPQSRNTRWRNEAFRGYADYMITPDFKNGIDRLLANASKRQTAIMCAEAVWWRCHRALIADCLKAAGHIVWHILGPSQLQEHPFSSAARLVHGRLSYEP